MLLQVQDLSPSSWQGLADKSADLCAVLIMRATGQHVSINQHPSQDTVGPVLDIAGQC